jgi:putative transposase
VADVEALTAAWVHWYNQQRLMHRLGRRPPSEAEAEYHQQQADQLIGKI